jgi:molybdopterin converting factor small subunit
VGAALAELARRYPGLAPHLFGEGGALRSYVNLFVNDQDVRTLSGERTPLSEEDRLMILPSVAGGRSMAANLKAVDHSALKTSMAVRLGILLAAFVTDQPWPIALLAALMLIGTARGKPEFSFVYRALRKANRISPEILSDNPEPHRFSLGVGGAFLAAGALAFGAGAAVLGWALTWIVIGLVALNLFGGFCVGCAVYYWLRRLGVPGFSKAPPPGVFPGRRPG